MLPVHWAQSHCPWCGLSLEVSLWADLLLHASVLRCFRDGHDRFLTILRTIFAEERESKNETDTAALEVCNCGSSAIAAPPEFMFGNIYYCNPLYLAPACSAGLVDCAVERLGVVRYTT